MNQFIIHNDIEFIYSKTGNIWHNFRNKKIFITGGTGFFGCWLLETIKWLNENKQLDLSATILTRNYKKFFKKAPHLANYSFFNFVEGDIKSFNFFHDNYHALIHFAATNAEETYHGEDELNKFITITCGTKRVLDFAIENNIKNSWIPSSIAPLKWTINALSKIYKKLPIKDKKSLMYHLQILDKAIAQLHSVGV